MTTNKLYRLTERIWVYPFEVERDRPNISYIRGDHWSLAVDAGHSDEQTRPTLRMRLMSGLSGVCAESSIGFLPGMRFTAWSRCPG